MLGVSLIAPSPIARHNPAHGQDTANRPDRRSDSAADWLAARLALQRGLGLLPQRRTRIGLAHSVDPALARKTLEAKAGRCLPENKVSRSTSTARMRTRVSLGTAGRSIAKLRYTYENAHYTRHGHD